MADLADVEKAVRETVQAVRDGAFPQMPVYRGWPADKTLADALKAGQAIVTILPRPGFNRSTTRYPNDDVPLPSVPPSLIVTVAGDTATFAGTCSADQIAGVQVGKTGWSHRCLATDTPASVASGLAALSGGSALGPALTLPGLVTAGTARDGGTLRPTRQQEVQIMVCIWCPTPDQRDQIGSAIDAALSDQDFLLLQDGSFARLKWAGGMVSDKAENANLYRRDLYYSTEFSTTIAGTATPVLFPGAVVGGARVGALAP